jgi:hypothetical protein
VSPTVGAAPVVCKPRRIASVDSRHFLADKLIASAFITGTYHANNESKPVARLGTSLAFTSKAKTTDEELARRGIEAECGIQVIDIRTSVVVHWLRLEGLVRDLYDVVVLPGVTRPMLLGMQDDEAQRTIAVGDERSL